MMTMTAFLLGAIAMSSLLAAMFFAKFWHETKDSLFLAFSLAFVLEATSRTLLALTALGSEGAQAIYGLRLAAYLMILIGIWNKNRQ